MEFSPCGEVSKKAEAHKHFCPVHSVLIRCKEPCPRVPLVSGSKM